MTDPHADHAAPGAASGAPADDAAGEPLSPRFLAALAALTLAGWGVAGLGAYALFQAWREWRLVFLAEAIMPLLLGGALSVFTTRAWFGLALRYRRRRT